MRADHVEPCLVTEALEHDRRIDDIGEDDRDCAVRGARRRNVRLLAPDHSLELLEAGRQISTEKLDVRFGQRPVHVYDLPLATFEMQDVCRPPVEAATR